MEIVRSITHNLVSVLSRKSICKVVLTALAITLFTFVSFIEGASYAWADTFSCYENCSNALKDSVDCLKDRDYTITALDETKDITVLSIHGGKIEAHTSEIGNDLWKRYRWNFYDFNGHIEKDSSCEKLDNSEWKDKNFPVLHITSTEFNEFEAIRLVGAYEKAVSIHGYSREEKEAGIRTICVGGLNTPQIEKFITNVNKESDKLKGKIKYSLNLVNVPLEQSKIEKNLSVAKKDTICLASEDPKQQALTGTDPSNIVNKTMDKSGGLQIELQRRIRDDLAQGKDEPQASPPNPNQLLRNVIYGAIKKAMTEQAITPP